MTISNDMDVIQPVTTVSDLGVALDSELTMRMHISKTTQTDVLFFTCDVSSPNSNTRFVVDVDLPLNRVLIQNTEIHLHSEFLFRSALR